jgi:spore maturation protein CgeB
MLDDFAKRYYDHSEYVDQYIEGDETLARYINKSKFCLAAPRMLQSPEETGDISPVTLRYYQAMACKSMPAGFKPREFDDIFSDDVFFIEYEDEEQFRDAISYYERNEAEYWEKVNRNYEVVNKNHTWAVRAQEFADVLETVF